MSKIKLITIYLDSYEEIAVKGTDSAVKSKIRIQIIGDWNESELVGTVLTGYLQIASVFLDEHPCKDCAAYLSHKKILEAIMGINEKSLEYYSKKDE